MILDYLRNKIREDRKYVLSLLISSNCRSKNGCLDKAIKNRTICKNCEEKLEKKFNEHYQQKEINFDEDISKIRSLFRFTSLNFGGHRFILEVPPKSFRNISRTKKRLKAYKEIVKFKMKGKNIQRFKKDKEIILHLIFQIKDYYNLTDCDNLAKSLCDSLQKILYWDDNQIKTLICEKIKVYKKINEGIIVAVKTV